MIGQFLILYAMSEVISEKDGREDIFENAVELFDNKGDKL